jgi:hypothetical protein
VSQDALSRAVHEVEEPCRRCNWVKVQVSPVKSREVFEGVGDPEEPATARTREKRAGRSRKEKPRGGTRSGNRSTAREAAKGFG